MAIKLKDKANTEAVSTEYPFGSIQDKITGVQSGTPVNRAVYSDMHQFFEKICDYTGKERNGQLDNANNGFELFEGLLDLLVKVANTSTTFNVQTSAEDNQWRDICYGGGLFLAVASSGTNRVMTSPDGITWTAVSVPALTYFYCTYGNGIFLIGDTAGTIYTSTDGVTWSLGTSSPMATLTLNVKYVNGLFILTGVNTLATNGLATSPDGVTWSVKTTPTLTTIVGHSITYGNGLYFVAAKNSGDNTIYSIDGDTWLASTTAITSINSVCFGCGKFVCVENGGDVYISSDGDTFTTYAAAITSRNHTSIIHGNGKYIAVASNGINTPFAYSYDGINWTDVNTNGNQWNAITYRNGLFVAVSLTGTGDRVFTTF